MLTWNVRLEGFDAQDWLDLWTILGPSGRPETAAEDGGGVVAVFHRRRLRKLLHTRRGALQLTGHPWPMGARDLAAHHGARWALVLEQGVLDAVMDDAAAQMQAEDDLLDQVLAAWRVVRALAREGRIDLWPGSIRTVPVPAKELIKRAVDLFVPDGKSVVIASWRGTKLHTSLAMRRSGLAFDVILGPNELREAIGRYRGDMRGAHHLLCDEVGRRLGPVAMGMSADAREWGTLAGDSEPGRWARIVATGAVVIDPIPAGVAIPIAVDAGRIAYLTLRSAARRLGPGRRGRDAETSVIERVPDFDLWTMLRAWAGLGAALRGRAVRRPG